MIVERTIQQYNMLLFALGCFFLLESVQKVFCANYTIDTSQLSISDGNGISTGLTGEIQERTFTGPNDEHWNHSVTVFQINKDEHKAIFNRSNKIVITGNNSLLINATGNFTVGTDLDLSGQEVEDNDKSLFRRGGFVRASNSCCSLGAGPGGAFTYHGGGHGGRGGGFYQDHNTSRYYGWNYYSENDLLGGSTGTAIFDSKAGPGGGAIEIIAHGGTLTIEANICADGFSTKNTSNEHCAGGSSGGLIRLKADTVIMKALYTLSAKGGDSGFSNSTQMHCGGGGGGGVVQVFSRYDNNQLNEMNVKGGKGLGDGQDGVLYQGVFFDDGEIHINTTECSMKWLSILLHQGEVSLHTYRTPDNKMTVSYSVCTFMFSNSLHIGGRAVIVIKGKHSLKIVSKKGNIELMTKVSLNGVNGGDGETFLGAFVVTHLTGQNVGPGNVTNCNANELFANDFKTLLGGSVCTSSNTNEDIKAIGGGALELVAESGTIVIGDLIEANGYSDKSGGGSMGGTIRLIAQKVHLKESAFFSAKASLTDQIASGGIIQIKSDTDIEGFCESKVDVTGFPSGRVNVMVSTEHSYQVQYIQEGNLLINTTLCFWVHRTNSSNDSMAYSQFGSINNVTTEEGTLSICSFNFKTPIIVNGSATVMLTGYHALSIASEQGIYIGTELIINSAMVAGEIQHLGGYCIQEQSQATTGNGPGKGRPSSSAGGGHGGKGGLFFEDNGKIYGGEYGLEPFLLIGGSTGTAAQSTVIQGCGGGSIHISSKKNLTLNAAIRANGYLQVNFDAVSYGGSSGGTIYLEAENVMFEEGAYLEARGSDASEADYNSTGGGGGGVIKINSTNSFPSNSLKPEINTRGGSGSTPGESGIVIINGIELREARYPVEEIPTNYSGCYRIDSLSALQHKKMLLHKAKPSTCLKECIANATAYAVIRKQLCYCLNDNNTFVRTPSMCNQTCTATFNYSCGGRTADIYSVYNTGIKVQVTEPNPTVYAPTTRPFNKPSSELKELSEVQITKNNSEAVVQKLANLTSTTQLNGGDTLAATNIFNTLATGNVLAPKSINETKHAGQAIVEIASALLSNENEASWKYLETRNTTNESLSSNIILESLENLAVDLGTGLQKEENITIETPHVVLGIKKKNLEDFTDEIYPQYDQLSSKWQYEDRITIPAETTMAFKTKGENEAIIFFMLYSEIHKTLKSNLQEGTVINSRVISAGFDRELQNPLPKPIKLSFTKYQMENYTDPVCSYLDFTNTLSGFWSSDGITMTSSEGNMFEFESSHLTNFAVLMQVKKFKISQPHRKALQMITYIGCGISLFGLALTLATFLSLETLASERTSIHKNLVIAIGLAQIIFLAGIDAVYNPIACKIVALSLHYLYTAAFTWMCCEGLHLYTKVIEVFSSETSKMKYHYMLGWGVPLIIVIISAAARMDGYGSESACWISIDHGLIWAFVGPVLVIMCINFVVMVMVIKVILASVTSIQNPGNTSQVKAGLKGMVVLLPLLGLTWVFGLMAVNEKTIAFQYIFAILNSLQGLFIFAFHCIGNSEVRVAYKRLHEKRTLAKSLPEHSLSSGNHHKEFNKRRMNSRETNSTGDEDIIVTKAIRSVSDVKLSGASDHVAMQTVRKQRPEKAIEVTETTRLTDIDTGEVSTVIKGIQKKKPALLTNTKDFEIIPQKHGKKYHYQHC